MVECWPSENPLISPKDRPKPTSARRNNGNQTPGITRDRRWSEGRNQTRPFPFQTRAGRVVGIDRPMGAQSGKQATDQGDHRSRCERRRTAPFPLLQPQAQPGGGGGRGHARNSSASKHCLAVNSCTSALVASLSGLGIGAGDEVIVPAYTFFATAARCRRRRTPSRSLRKWMTL